MSFNLSERLQQLPPYLFVEIDKAKRKAREEGRDIIDLGIGDPDQPTPQFVIEALVKAAHEPANHRYALDQGMPSLRQAIARWYHRKFDVILDSDKEILPLIGSKEGIAHFPLAFLNKGDVSLVPDPCYPPYKGGTILAGGLVQLMPLLEKNNFLPDFTNIPKNKLKKAKILYLNYPNNPTASVCDLSFYKEAVSFAKKHNLIIVSDLAYSEITYDGYHAPSIFNVAGAKDLAIEFHSLSKTYNMTGWRVAWACGNSQLVQGLAKVKSNIDSGIFSAIQVAATAALEADDKFINGLCNMYRARRDCLIKGLEELGWKPQVPKATFYVWVKVPKKKSSIEFAKLLLDKADVVVTPGVGFGPSGEGFIRFALTQAPERIQEAVARLKKVV
ncbi:MAG: LL-diaminopimelate aminotransferase [Candidatus Omnitrophica bacterium]|nr:LL-diaminopimelate aminotransferase [Candidatus Omnitrophota bacterium]